jgi:hypothetical protein
MRPRKGTGTILLFKPIREERAWQQKPDFDAVSGAGIGPSRRNHDRREQD